MIAAHREPITGVVGPELRVAGEMSGMQPLGDGAIAEQTLATVALDDLDLEPLLVRTPTRLSKHGLAIFEQRERLGVNCVTSGDADWKGAKLDQKEPLNVVPRGNPALPHFARGA